MMFAKRTIAGISALLPVLVLALALAPPPAHAARGEREADQVSDRQDGRPQGNQRGGPNSSAQRNDAGDQQRAQRLSPEERRQLRRDIRDAGREIYPRRR